MLDLQLHILQYLAKIKLAEKGKSIVKNDLNGDTVIQAIYFDGRIDLTLCIKKSGDGKKHQREPQEDHKSLV